MLKRDDMAIDAKGHPMPWTPEQVRAKVLQMIDEGDIKAVIIEDAHGDLGVQVFGPPSRQLLDVLETATRAYRRVLKGH